MLPGIGGGELIVIAVVALIVVGPKDLPKLLRTLGRFVGKMRGMADDFRASFDDMARQSELDDLRKEVEALRSGNSVSPLIDDLTHDMKAITSDVSNSLNNSIHGSRYGAPNMDATEDYMSPDSHGGHESPPEAVSPTVAEAAPAKPKRTRAKAIKAEVVPEAEAEPVARPKRVRKPKAIMTAGDL